jgi:tRNA U34 5-methylaminomethyl-2-thiouridine-forming methyltransferase MnmC
LKYGDKVAGGKFSQAFMKMHELPFGKETRIHPGFMFSKWQIGLDLAPLASNSFHLVFHDAFAPQFQPELWDEEAFGRLHSVLKPGGKLVTYSAKGSVKRALTACGFALKHPPGPVGKREMTVAVK